MSDKAALVDKLMTEKKFKALVQLYKKTNDDTYKEFDSLRYRNGEVKVGQYVLLQELPENPIKFAAIIKKIICIRDPENTFIPLVKVQWFGEKEDIEVPQQFEDCVSEKELFLSTQESYVPVDLLHQNIRVLTFDEYDQLQQEQEFVYFSRAGYNHLTKEVTPPFVKWPKTCLCGKPSNPDHQFIQCDRCQQWFHSKCVGMIDAGTDFKCARCS